MKLLRLLAVVVAAPLVFAGEPENAVEASALNVNSRYTVESITLSPLRDYQLSDSVLDEMERLVGERLNIDAMARLARRITRELRAERVTFRIARGNVPAQVRVTFDVERQETRFDASLSRLMYSSALGFTGQGQVTATHGDYVLTAVGVANGDDLVEHYSGVQTRLERLNVGSRQVRLGLEFDAFHNEFAPATLASLATPNSSSLGAAAYRSRLNVEPSATFVVAGPLTMTLGLSFETLQPWSAGETAQSANAFVSTFHYHQHWGDSDVSSQDLDASYRLRSATKLLGSSMGYTKHAAHLRYTYRHERQMVEVAVKAGVIYGQAPLFERFVLGNSSTLRGWNKDDIDPIGGNRVAHASVTYGYRIMRVFYDTGSVWDHGKSSEDRNSVGAGVTTGLGILGKDALLLAVAFPVRRGAVVPVFVAGMNF